MGKSRASSVRGHTRRTKSGGTTTVRRHDRIRKGGMRPARAGRNLGRAWRAVRRGRKAVAFTFVGLAVLELGAWATLQGGQWLATAAGLLAVGLFLLFRTMIRTARSAQVARTAPPPRAAADRAERTAAALNRAEPPSEAEVRAAWSPSARQLFGDGPISEYTRRTHALREAGWEGWIDQGGYAVDDDMNRIW